jgi:hypothetical protein
MLKKFKAQIWLKEAEGESSAFRVLDSGLKWMPETSFRIRLPE